MEIERLISILHETDPDWTHIPVPEAARLRAVADARDRQKNGFASSRYWNADSHYIGLLGEWIYGRKVGLEPNLELLIEGDGGYDFGGVDVKTSTFLDAPHLKHPVGATRWPAAFALVSVDVENLRGRYEGYATASELRASPTREYRPGFPQHHLFVSDLHRGLPQSEGPDSK